MAPPHQEEALDKRLSWFEARLNNSWKLKPLEIKKLFENEDYRSLLLDFCDKDTRSVFISQLPTGGYGVFSCEHINEAAQRHQLDFRRKVMYFIKPKPKDRLGDDKTMSIGIIFGDLTVDVLQSLNDVYAEVAVPLLHNKKAVEKQIPAVCVSEMLDVTQDFTGTTLVTMGRAHHLTLLPLPSLKLPMYINPTTANANKSLILSLESTVTKWTELIREAVDTVPEKSLPPLLRRPIGPLDEIAFWKGKAQNLMQLEKQLCQSFIVKSVVILKLADSHFYPAFASLINELHDSLEEATEIYRYLKPLSDTLEMINVNGQGHLQPEQISQQKVFRQLFHLLFLIWTNCPRFATIPKMANFIYEIANDVIDNAKEILNIMDVFNQDTEEIQKSLAAVLTFCGEFKAAFFLYKARTVKELQRPWRFQNSTLFRRMDAFLERCHDLLDFIDISGLFFRLANLKIGTYAGINRTEEVEAIQAEFTKKHGELQQVTYDLLDVDDDSFDKDYEKFRLDVRELEKQLGNLMNQSIEDAANGIPNVFKIVDSFEGFTERPLLHQQWADRQTSVLRLWHRELLNVQEIFHAEKDNPPAFPNVPPVTSAILWTNGLAGRISASYGRVLDLDKSIIQSDLGKEAIALYESLKASLKSYSHGQYENWAGGVGQLSQEKLQLFLLARHPDPPNEYRTNFDPALVRTLRESAYIESFAQDYDESFVIPPQAAALSKQRDVLRSFVLRLDYVCDTVNSLERTLLACERALFSRELAAIEVKLMRGLQDLRWRQTESVEQYLADIVADVSNLERTVETMHSNVKRMRDAFSDILTADNLLPLQSTKTDVKILSETDFRRKWFAEHTIGRETRFKAANELIGTLVAETLDAINGPKNRGGNELISADSVQWATYLEHVSGEVEEALTSSIVGSLKLLRDQMDEKWLASHNGLPLFEMRLILTKPTKDEMLSGVTPAMGFEPVLKADEGKGGLTRHSSMLAGRKTDFAKLAKEKATSLQNLLADVIASIIHQSSLVSRVVVADTSALEAGGSPSVTFETSVARAPAVTQVVNEIEDLTRLAAGKCIDFGEQFQTYQYLYIQRMESKFQEFLDQYDEDKKADKSIRPAEEAAAAGGKDGKQQQAAAGGDAPAAAAEGEENQEGKVASNRLYFVAPLPEFQNQIHRYEELQGEIEELPQSTIIAFVKLDCKPMRTALVDLCLKWRTTFSAFITNRIITDLQDLYDFMQSLDGELGVEVSEGDVEALKRVMRCIRECRRRDERVRQMMEPISEAAVMLLRHPDSVPPETLEKIEELRKPVVDSWSALYRKSLNVREQNSIAQDREAERIKEDVAKFEEIDIGNLAKEMRRSELYEFTVDPPVSYTEIDKWATAINNLDKRGRELRDLQLLFDLQPTDFREIRECRQEMVIMKQIWDVVNHVTFMFKDWLTSTFSTVDVDGFLDEIKRLNKLLKIQSVKAKAWGVFHGIEQEVINMGKSLPLCAELRSPAMRSRHWDQLLRLANTTGTIDPEDSNFTLQRLISLGIHNHSDDILGIVEQAQKELQIEKALIKISDAWEKMVVSYDTNSTLDIQLLAPVDHVVEQLELDTLILQGMLANRFVEYFVDRVNMWQKNLGLVDTCLNKWVEIQRKWVNLYPIFVLSADIREQLQDEARNFGVVDELFRSLMRVACKETAVIPLLCSKLCMDALHREEDLDTYLQQMEDILVSCEKALTDYLEMKRKIFPRFFFVSASDLVDILSKGSNPRAVMVHMSKIIDSTETFTFDNNPAAVPGIEMNPKQVWEIISVQGEHVKLSEDYICEGPVEHWLDGCVKVMQRSIKMHILEANAGYVEKPRTEWIYQYPTQAVIVASRIWYTAETQQAFQQMEEGNDNGMKDFLKAQKAQLDTLVKEVLYDRKKTERSMLVHLITIDVHNRDIVQTLVDERVDSVEAFRWQSQLRYYLDDGHGSIVRICDAEFFNGYEYIGLCGCLVITKLTDRCYITLSQALKLYRGGAPAGPAGTGKTETTKDLARNLGICCYVFNCSEQMNYITLGSIFKGLAMSGSWGCFDEFNRISIEVLSVVATQVGSILNALKARKKRFRFEKEDINIEWTVGMFITMNPGYAGRTELPENIKALFRPCAMVVPDLKNICEIMLAAEGFGDAKDLALKFVTLYKLNKELLSPQDHYDWGLRAVKSVLYIAGALKRGDPDVPERKVLMRALRDTNLAKLSKDDVYVFMGLIRALFPNLEVPKKINVELNDALKAACKDMKNLPGENDIFILKCAQYEELLHVRHSVFILGPAGCGKTQAWKCLQQGLAKLGDKCVTSVMSPNAITSFELYGFIHPQTKEWRDGILSNVFRQFALESKTKKNSKWIVLDGVINAEWIESMNTVMDDNKMLTLVSNERIPLTASMRMIFEVSHLRFASPATVSRAGVVFINESDLGYGCFKDKWLASRTNDRESIQLEGLFDRYLPIVLEYYHRSLKTIVTLMDIGIVQSVCFMLEGLLDNLPKDTSPEVYEKYFCFSVLWAIGGPLPSDGRIDYRQLFSNWWRKEYPHCRFGETGTVFDFFIDASDKYEFKPWTELVTPYNYNPEVPLSQVVVQTADTVRMNYLMSLLVDKARPVMLIATAGTGKSNLILNKLRSLDVSVYTFRTVAFNARTDSNALQQIFEQNLEKRTGRQFGPIGRKKLIFFLDDLNMPTPDKYGTQSSIALLQQHYEHGFWYDKIKIQQKEVSDIRYCAAMNPKSGTFTILDRLLRQFTVFCANMPDRADLSLIYGQILKAHFKENNFAREVRDVADPITQATIELHLQVTKTFLPNAILFHYQWNMRELFNIFQGMCNSHPKVHLLPDGLCRLWYHECCRTFRDRMCRESDISKFNEMIGAIQKQFFPAMTPETWAATTTSIWAPFTVTKDGEEGVYDEIPIANTDTYLNTKLDAYNQDNAVMELVLFKEALEHVCRICRVISNPRGNALLVGVGGSGKQSLARLASYICGFETYQIAVTNVYTINDFRGEVQELYKKCGLKQQSYTFLITDLQIVSQDMLVYLNDMLSSGNIPDLFTQDERDGIIGSVTNEVKAAGIADYSNPDVCWDFYINRVRQNLHTVLCMSPLSKTFAQWCRQFPALSNTTIIDWFFPWPRDALQSVARNKVGRIEVIANDPRLLQEIGDFMAETHLYITDQAEEFYAETKRRAYTTPKSFLELIKLYETLLGKKQHAVQDKISRLMTGLDKIRDAASRVAQLQQVLQKESVEVEEARMNTMTLMEKVGHEKAIVQEQSALAEQEEAKTNKIVVEVEAFAAECKKDLDAAQPLVQEALNALKTLDKNNLTELKAMPKPPDDVVMVVAAVRTLTSDPRRIPPARQRDWAVCKGMMSNVAQWMTALEQFDVNNIPQPCVDAIQMYITNPSFTPGNIVTKSFAASGLCKWVIGMNEYHKVRCEVKPKEERLAEAQDRLASSRAALKKIQDKVNDLKAKLDTLLAQYNDAVSAANAIEAKARKTRDKMALAERLVSGLADEKVRWGKLVEQLRVKDTLLIGDTLLASAFVSYVGPFSREYRARAVEEIWKPQLAERNIPMTDKLDIILGILTSDAEVASWNNEGLPADPVSTENGAICCNCSRWPLLIDPQLQGVRWIRTREGPNKLVATQQGGNKWLAKVVACVEEGLPCLIEGLGENIDPVLDNVLARATYRRGSRTMMRIGAHDVEYNPKFRLILQTKLSNPIYKPEINAQTTLINFMVTEAGLEDQLLAVVVNQERPDLEAKRGALLRQMNTMTIELQECEDSLLFELSNATGDILENVALVEKLEATKKKAVDINRSMKLAVDTQLSIASSRQSYRSAAARGSLIYFQIDQLCKIDHTYQYSLEAFMVVFNKALSKAEQPENPKDLAARVANVTRSITESVFAYVARGLFERHKLIFSSMLCFAILGKDGKIDPRHFDFLLRGKKKIGFGNRPEPVKDFISEANWTAVLALADVEGTTPSFNILPADIADSARWKLWCESEKPEDEKLPQAWKDLTAFQRLLVLRCLRPDRLTAALENFVRTSIGKFFVSDQAVDVAVSYGDSGPTTPLFFILSPGVDPSRGVQALGEKLGYSFENDKFFTVSLGQGQEVIADEALLKCYKEGGWVLLSNIHLVADWLTRLDKTMDSFSNVYTKMAQIAKSKADAKAARRLARQVAKQGEQMGDDAASANGEDAANNTNNNGQQPHGENSGEQQHHQGDAAAAAGTTAEGEKQQQHKDGEKPEGDAAASSTNKAEQQKKNNNAAAAANEESKAEHDGENADAHDNDNNHHQKGEDEEGEEREAEEEEESEPEEEEDETEFQDDDGLGKGSMNLRIFLSAEPSDVIPQGILQRCIKLTSEPPTGIAQNVNRALMNFSDDPWEKSAKPTEFRCITFAMCFFHAVLVERKKFGAQGWNRVYPFNVGDLTTCIDVLVNYIEDRPKVPWEDLRYVFGEIMYGGHITDDWDRILCMAYLSKWVNPDVTDSMELCPGFPMPPPGNYQDYVNYVDQFCPPESPILYGLHPNAEINYRTVQADVLFKAISELQPKKNIKKKKMTAEEAAEEGKKASLDGPSTPEEIVKAKLDELLDKSPEQINMVDIVERLDEDRTPPQHVFFQEIERINKLLGEMKRALFELDLGLKGALSMSADMQLLFDELFMDKIPTTFRRYSFDSLRTLSGWHDSLNARYQQLQDWTGELQTPKVTQLNLFFNPMSFLTAIMQATSIANSYDLDQMSFVVDVTKKAPDQIDIPARDGAYVYGLTMEGARWDSSLNSIDESRMKELYPRMPVVHIKSLPSSKVDRRDQYECPVYRTQARGPTIVVGLFLKTKQPARKWIIAGVGIILDVVE